ncbi:MAG: hypothetical protein H7840_00280 [Alphaproteobacteria bacterium]
MKALTRIAAAMGFTFVAAVGGVLPAAAQGPTLVPGLEKAKIILSDDPVQEPIIAEYFKKGTNGAYIDPYSGYPDLKDKLQSIFGKNCGIGHPVPINLINGKYYTLSGKSPANPELDKNVDNVRKAYESAWIVKNPAYANYTFSNMTQSCTGR